MIQTDTAYFRLQAEVNRFASATSVYPAASNETSTPLEYIEYNIDMSSSIRISDETKRKLELVKRDDETYDELLSRLATTEKEIEERGGFADDDVVEEMARARDELNESLESRSDLQ